MPAMNNAEFKDYYAVLGIQPDADVNTPGLRSASPGQGVKETNG